MALSELVTLIGFGIAAAYLGAMIWAVTGIFLNRNRRPRK